MTLTPILVFSLIAIATGWIVPRRWRMWVILVTSLAAIYWLQPGMPLRNLDFWLPTTSILLIVLVWSITQARLDDVETVGSPGTAVPPRSAVPLGATGPQRPRFRSLIVAGLVLLTTILVISLARYVDPFCCLTATRPPDTWRVAIFLLIGIGAALLPIFFVRARRPLAVFMIILIIGLFIILKSPALAQSTSFLLRQVAGQQLDLASGQDILWFGFSFLAFRLLHVLFDFRAGKLPAYSLEEFVAYAIFFPAYPAGPIDRSQRFVENIRQPDAAKGANTAKGSWRIIWGLFKKFVVADSLALIALNSQNATQIDSPVWMWTLLYLYSLRIYFDFSGYTDIAIGLGNLMGINLPENFDRPYLKTNLTAFWNSWHITLAGWFRAYFFNPLTRFLRSRSFNLPTWSIILLGQFFTMLLIGLWHGITWNFAFWGAWHGVGLFIHNRWSAWSRSRWSTLEDRRFLHVGLQLLGWFLTFNYVSLGWVWFILPDLALSRLVFFKLLGI